MEDIVNEWRALQGVELFLGLAALVGGLVFLVRLLLQFLGFGLEMHEGSGIDAHHSDPDAGFRVLSLHGVSAFFMMFGLVGLALRLQTGLPGGISVLGGCVAGAVTVYLLREMFRVFMRVQSSGTIANAAYMGCVGVAYSTIPAQGVGMVIISVAGRQREKEARSADGVEIPTGTPVVVTAVEGNCVVVKCK